MAQHVLRIEGLPQAALEAAAAFHAEWRAQAEGLLQMAQELVLVLPHASPDHDDWRRSVVRDLARAHTPRRVNLVSGGDEAAIAATLDYLARAPGVTGQCLPVGSKGRANPAQ